MTFKRVDYSLVSCLVSLLVGLVMVLRPELVANYLVFAVGLLFLIPGAVAIIIYFVGNKRDKGFGLPFRLSALGSIFFGLLLMIIPSFFADIIAFVIGLSIAFGGLFQIIQVYNAREWTRVSVLAYILPVILLILGILMLFNPTEAKETSFFIMGIGVLAYSLTSLINWFVYSRKRPKTPIRKEMDIEDAEIINK